MNTQKGFSTLLVLLLILVVTVGVWVYTQTEIFYKTDSVVEDVQKNNESIKSTSTKVIKSETMVTSKVDFSLSDEVINDILKGESAASSNWVDIDLGFSEITKGDINDDGYEDALFIVTSCGASCGSSLGAIINQKNGEGKNISINSEKYIRPSSAMQTGITDIQISNGTVSITANGFIGEDDWDESVTKKFKVENNALVEIM